MSKYPMLLVNIRWAYASVMGVQKHLFFQISNSMVAYPIQLQCLTHHNKFQSPSLSFKGVPSTMKYTKEILKNTKEK